MSTDLRRVELPPFDGTDEHTYVLRTAVWLRTQVPGVGGIELVATGAAATCVPRLALALHAMGAPALAFRLVDPAELPPVLPDWPDAPVTFALTATADERSRALSAQARLRGWTVED